MIARPIALLLAGALAAAPTAAAQTSSVAAPFPNVTGVVNALVVDGDTAYVGGSFSALGQRPAPFAVVSAADGTFVRSWPVIVRWGSGDGPVPARADAIAPAGSGGWYVGGDFLRVDGTSIAWLAHIRSDGSADPAFRAHSN